MSRLTLVLRLLLVGAPAVIIYTEAHRRRRERTGTMSIHEQTEAAADEGRGPAQDAPADQSVGGSPAGKSATQAQTKTGLEGLGLAGDLGARNVEAMMSLVRIALSGMEAFAREALDQSRRSSEQSTETLRALAGARTAADLLSVQSNYLKATGQALLGQATRTREIAQSTGKALIEGCSSHAQEMAAGYAKVTRR
jgi:hypothetical protein